MTPSEILLKAAEYIEEHGWYQGDYNGPDGEVCALGAINKVCKGIDEGAFRLYEEAQNILNKYAIDQGLNTPDWSFAHYNDLPTTTKDDVLRMMRAAAA